MTGYYLLDHPNPACPDRGDGRYWGYAVMAAPPRWVTVHTAESFADQLGVDMGAENVAAYFARSTEPASYHTIVDSDSTVRCLPAGLDGTVVHTAFHCYQRNTGNLGVSIAMRAEEWRTVDDAWGTAVLRRAAAETALWCAAHGIPVVQRTLAEVDAGLPGVTGHGIIQPVDRTDPGALFPWDRFMDMVRSFAVPAAGGSDDKEGFEMRAYRTNQGGVIVVDGSTFRVVPATQDWDHTNAGLVELVEAGLLPAGDQALPTIGDNAVQMMREVAW